MAGVFHVSVNSEKSIKLKVNGRNGLGDTEDEIE
jgi:hypothetical protein